LEKEVNWDRIRRFKWSDAAPPPDWDQSLRPISQRGLALFALDGQGKLYWDGQLVETHARLRLTWLQMIIGGIVVAGTVAGGAGGTMHGWVAYKDWSCRIEWQAPDCPPRAVGMPGAF